MKLFKYTPEGDIFDGFIEIEIPNNKERVDIALDLNSKGNDDLKQAKAVTDLIYKHVKSVSLTAKEMKIKFDNLEDLSYYEEGQDVIKELGPLIIRGIPLGNALRQQLEFK